MDTFFESLLSQPTAPFREIHSRQTVLDELTSHGVPHFLDPIGNIVIGAESKADYLRLIRASGPEPIRIFIAHLDHPGFHGTTLRTAAELEFKWHGGSPVEHLIGAKVWLSDGTDWAGSGTLTEVKLAAHGKAIESGVIRLEAPHEGRADRLYGGFQFRAPIWREGELAYTQAADDLVGCYVIATLAKELLGKRKPNPRNASKRIPMLGLLTRAEEVGFIGAIGHFELGWWRQAKRPLLAVSLETSRQLPGAEIGKGPVVRLGDRATVFSNGPLRILIQLAEKVLPGKHQKRIMDGGTCEGTAATAYGIATIGISIPLGNYHNQSFEGGPDSRGPNGPAPEFVHVGDTAGMLTLCRGVMESKHGWDAPWKTRVIEFRAELKRYRPLLKGL